MKYEAPEMKIVMLEAKDIIAAPVEDVDDVIPGDEI